MRLEDVDVIVHDRLVGSGMLDWTRYGAERRQEGNGGKSHGDSSRRDRRTMSEGGFIDDLTNQRNKELLC